MPGGIHEKQVDVGPGESDLFGMCRPAAILDYLQVLALEQAALLGISREAMIRQHNCVWLLAREWYQLRRPILRGEHLTITTWPSRMVGASFYRDFDLRVQGELVGEAVSIWVLADVESRTLLRVSELPKLAAAPRPDCLKQTVPKRLSAPPDLQPAMERRIRYSDTDINGHMNNARYADVVCDALEFETLQGQYADSMQINFLRECRAGETLTILTSRSGADAFVRGSDAAGTPRFDAKLHLSAVRRADENDP